MSTAYTQHLGEPARHGRLDDTAWKWQLQKACRSVDQLNAELAAFTDFRVESTSLTRQVETDLFAFKVTPFMISALRRAIDLRIPGAWEAFCASFVPSPAEINRAADSPPPCLL